MINHDEDFDLKFAPEFGQAAADESEELVETPDENPEEEYEEGEYEEDDDDGEEAGEELELEYEEEEEEAVPLSRYNELRKTFTQKTMELADLKKSLATQPPQETPQAKPQSVLAKSLEDIVDAKVNTKLETLLAPIREQEEELQLQQAILVIAESDPHFKDVSPMFLKQLEDSPGLFDIEGGLNIAYRAAKAEYLERVSVARVKAETKEAVQRRQMKENISDGSSYTRPVTKARTDADSIKESIMGLGVRRPL